MDRTDRFHRQQHAWKNRFQPASPHLLHRWPARHGRGKDTTRADKNQIHVMSVKKLPASKVKEDSMKKDDMSK